MKLFLLLSTALQLLKLSESFNVYIDGSAGTTGLQVRDRLKSRKGITLLQIPDDLRKDDGARKEYMEKADAVVLCLPGAYTLFVFPFFTFLSFPSLPSSFFPFPFFPARRLV